jgi:hypothetical protein
VGVGYDIKSRKIWSLYEQQDAAAAAATNHPDASSSSSSSSAIDCPAAPEWLVEGELHLPSVSFPDVDWILGVLPSYLHHHPSLPPITAPPRFSQPRRRNHPLHPSNCTAQRAEVLLRRHDLSVSIVTICLTRAFPADAVTLYCPAASGTSKASSKTTTRGLASTRCAGHAAAAAVAASLTPPADLLELHQAAWAAGGLCRCRRSAAHPLHKKQVVSICSSFQFAGFLLRQLLHFLLSLSAAAALCPRHHRIIIIIIIITTIIIIITTIIIIAHASPPPPFL